MSQKTLIDKVNQPHQIHLEVGFFQYLFVDFYFKKLINHIGKKQSQGFFKEESNSLLLFIHNTSSATTMFTILS